MSSVNKVILIGRLGENPQFRTTNNGKSVSNFSMATSFNRNGEESGQTEWHRVVVWGKHAESVNKYLSKGKQAYVEGYLQTRKWEDKQGNPRYTTEVIANNVTFLGNRGDSPAQDMGAGPGIDDDIPF